MGQWPSPQLTGGSGMDQPKLESTPDTAPAWLIKTRRILIPTLLILMLMEAITGWGLRTACRTCNIPGEYWLLIAASAIALPLVGLCLVAMVVSLIVAIVLLIRSKPDRLALGSSAALLFLFAVGYVVAGFVNIAAPISHDASLSVGGKMYHLATVSLLVDNQVLLYECDGSGLLCSKIFASGDLYPLCEPYTLTADPATGQVSIQNGGGSAACASTIYTTNP
jgi:hypothetical protein